MSDASRRESPLVGRIEAGLPVRMAAERVRLQERAFLGHISLRCDPADAGVTASVEGALQCNLPRIPNTYHVARAGHKVLWLGPDEWLVVTPEGREDTLAQSLRMAAGDGFATVIELGSGQTVIEISGERAREVIAKGCPLDLHPRAFGPGRCAQSRLARTLVTLAQLDDAPTFELIVRRSFADYLWQWLSDACRHPVEPRFV
ncbi:MAG TPA: sarcosine oxidase subunit gamma family protein [Burkholderiaceae bacterium]|jgi:sarcosine oxidase subunit gamma|nr:sarcosine oxidase subunit gamma family protein [Burkholderiaceae bacterium]